MDAEGAKAAVRQAREPRSIIIRSSPHFHFSPSSLPHPDVNLVPGGNLDVVTTAGGQTPAVQLAADPGPRHGGARCGGLHLEVRIMYMYMHVHLIMIMIMIVIMIMKS